MSITTELARPWLSRYSPMVPPDLPPPAASPIEQFRAAARRNPAAPAIYYFDTPISFGRLDQLSSSLAVALIERGLQLGDRVALDMQNIPQFWIAQLAIWKAGGIVVPLNPMFKAAELEYHLNDSGASVLITLEPRYAEIGSAVLPRTGVRQVITTSALDLLDQPALPAALRDIERVLQPGLADLLELCERHATAADPATPLGPRDIAYLTYTSGTTGRPKGAMNSHGNIAFTAEVYRVWAGIGPGDVIVGMAPLFHITGLISNLAVAGLAGVPLILAYRFDASELLRLTARWRGSFTVAAITAFIALMNYPELEQHDLSTLRKAYSGGAPIAPPTVERFQALTGVRIHNVFGMTETTSPTHMVPLGTSAPVDPASGALSIGLPVPNTLARLIDLETGLDAAPGEPGELFLRGPGVIGGYWQRREESALAFRDGWLATGDVARMDDQGWFYIVDRKKDMIIASGFKVWPREVEEVLYQHPAVHEAAVIGVPDAYRGETVKAVVSLKAGAQIDSDELIAFCKANLSAYKYPRIVQIVAELPKTATGKILRRALRDQ